jgi:hypothetical protein
MINTELPNVLSFAAVTEGAQATSRNFWADDIWWRIFHEKGDYELYMKAINNFFQKDVANSTWILFYNYLDIYL